MAPARCLLMVARLRLPGEQKGLSFAHPSCPSCSVVANRERPAKRPGWATNDQFRERRKVLLEEPHTKLSRYELTLGSWGAVAGPVEPLGASSIWLGGGFCGRERPFRT